MAGPQLYTEQEIRERMLASIVARTDITDVNDSSVVKRIAAATASEIGDAYYGHVRLREAFGLRSGGTDLDERAGDYPPSLEGRRGPLFSLGYLQVSRATASVATATAVAGTALTNPLTGFQYVLMQDATIASGDTSSNEVLGRSVLATPDADADAGTITVFADGPPAGITSVVNTSNFRGGRDAESDVDFRRRILEHVAKLSGASLRAMEAAVIGIQDEETLKTIQFTSSLIDLGTPGRAYVYIDDSAGTVESTVEFEDEEILSVAQGGEQYMQAPAWPLKVESGVSITVNRSPTPVTPTYGVDFLVNPATGLIYFVDAAYIEAGDQVEIDCTAYTGLVKLAQYVISGDTTDELNTPGVEAGGTITRVLPLTVNDVYVEAAITLADNAPDGAIDRAQARVIDYVNSIRSSSDGRTVFVVRNEIIGAITAEPGVFDLDLIAPTSNIPVSPGSRARATPGTVALTEAGA